MALRDSTHNELVQLLARNCGNEQAWREFIRRFERFIASIIIKQCRQLHHEQGLRQIEDLLYQVYARLLENDCQALRRFRARHDNSIIKYLKIIAVRIVLTDFVATRAQKRRGERGEISLDNADWQSYEKRSIDLKDIIPVDAGSDGTEHTELLEEIEHCLQQALQNSRHASRDLLIFKYYFYEGFQVEDIATMGAIDVSQKRISNIISDLKEALRICLRKRGINGV